MFASEKGAFLTLKARACVTFGWCGRPKATWCPVQLPFWQIPRDLHQRNQLHVCIRVQTSTGDLSAAELEVAVRRGGLEGVEELGHGAHDVPEEKWSNRFLGSGFSATCSHISCEPSRTLLQKILNITKSTSIFPSLVF